MKMLNLLIGRSCRSDYPLTDPLIKLIHEEWCNPFTINLIPAKYIESYNYCQAFIDHHPKFDLVLVAGDRIEMAGLAQCAFLNDIKIIHLGAGITNNISTFDDILRHNITLQSTIALCEDYKSANNVLDLWNIIKKNQSVILYHTQLSSNNIHVIGNIYLDEIDVIDESLVPKEPYDLVLLNEETLQPKEFTYIDIIPENLIIFIGSNPDKKVDYEKVLFKYESQNLAKMLDNDCKIYDNLPRPQFLGLLKGCSRFISNSSSIYYEASHFLKDEQIIQVGERNKNRSTPKHWNQDFKSSDKIIEILKGYYQNNILKEEKKDV